LRGGLVLKHDIRDHCFGSNFTQEMFTLQDSRRNPLY
jgi:hypothetical protein